MYKRTQNGQVKRTYRNTRLTDVKLNSIIHFPSYLFSPDKV